MKYVKTRDSDRETERQREEKREIQRNSWKDKKKRGDQYWLLFTKTMLYNIHFYIADEIKI